MTNPSDLEARVTALESRVDQDLSGLTTRMDAHRFAISALGEQTRGRFDALDERIASVEGEMRAGFAVADENFRMIDENFRKVDKRFRKIDERFRKIDERFRKIDERFEAVDGNFRKIDAGFVEIRGKLDQTTAGLQHIVRLLTPDDPAGPAGSAPDQ